MSGEFVGQEKKGLCQNCEKRTLHYLYHSGEWVCIQCGGCTEELE